MAKPLTGIEREAIRDLRRLYQRVVEDLDDALKLDRVDRAMECLVRIVGDTDGLAARTACRLGHSRQVIAQVSR